MAIAAAGPAPSVARCAGTVVGTPTVVVRRRRRGRGRASVRRGGRRRRWSGQPSSSGAGRWARSMRWRSWSSSGGARSTSVATVTTPETEDGEGVRARRRRRWPRTWRRPRARSTGRRAPAGGGVTSRPPSSRSTGVGEAGPHHRRDGRRLGRRPGPSTPTPLHAASPPAQTSRTAVARTTVGALGTGHSLARGGDGRLPPHAGRPRQARRGRRFLGRRHLRARRRPGHRRSQGGPRLGHGPDRGQRLRARRDFVSSPAAGPSRIPRPGGAPSSRPPAG